MSTISFAATSINPAACALEFRLINCLKVGDSTATGQIMRAGTGIEETLLRIKSYMAEHNITWTTPPPIAVGDGLLVVRSAQDSASGAILFLSSDAVVSGTPADYRQALALAGAPAPRRR